MKTRIVYPQMWLDEKFVLCSPVTKTFFNYLINNVYLGLSRYCRISERRLEFETGLTTEEIAHGKKELEDLKWCFFHKDWIYHNHECAYVDYSGNLKVEVARAKEIDLVPKEIKEVFERLTKNGHGVEETLIDEGKLKGSTTGYEGDINHKSKTINHKSEIRDGLVIPTMSELVERARRL